MILRSAVAVGDDSADMSPPPESFVTALADPAATGRLAARIAPDLAVGDAVMLEGPLGAGKTCFARGVIQTLAGTDEEVPSPTFTLVQTYPTPKGTIWHFDLYRLADADEVVELGWDEALTDGILLVEWPDRLGPLTPADRLAVRLDGDHGRTACLAGFGTWRARLAALAPRWCEAAP